MGKDSAFDGCIVADDKCPLCDGVMYLHEDDIVCEDCYFVLEPRRKKVPDLWEKFHEERENYSGKFGRERKRCVGGFIGVYIFGPADSIEENIYG